jgi:Putative Ig domain/Fibronectin type III domain
VFVVRVPAILPRVVVAAVLVTAAGLPAGVLAAPPSSTGAVDVSAAVAQAVSPPMRNLGPTAPSAANLRERPLRLVGPGSSPNQPDGALQTTAGPAVATTRGLSFDGVGVCGAGAGCWAPPDTNGAVGATQYVQWVNTAYAVFDKTTGAEIGIPIAGNAIWASLGGSLGGGCATNNDGDPIVQYDKIANRWILTQFSITGANGTSIPYLQCVAVSQTSDATGAYYLYAFGYSQFPDYPKLGVWPDAYYVTFNMFTSTFVGPQVCAYHRAAMLTGAAATQQCFQLSNSYGAMLPGDFDGTILPPSGAPNPVLSLGTNSLNLWRFHVDWTNSANTTLTSPINVPVASFSRACNGSNCVPQPSTSQKLDSLGDRLMYRLAYRNFGDHESLVVNHSVSVGGNLFKSGVSSVRWYELRNVTSGTPTVFQQGTLGASDGIHRWMGSIAMDQVGDIALGYSASSGSVYPSIRYTGRVPTDALGTMEAESIVQAGSGSQLQNLSRWGDYSAMSVDPVDDCTFWYTNEYLKTSGTWNWSTRIASFKFPGCGSAATVPGAPTIGTATAGNAQAAVGFSPPASDGGSPIASYTVTSTPGNLTATGPSSPITVMGLTNGTAYTFTVHATNAVGPGPESSPSNSVTPAAATLSITTPSLPAGTAGQLYSQTVAETGGTPSYTWSISAGVLPAGLSLDASSGTISGTVSQTAKPGNYSFTVTVTDSSATPQTASQALSIRISKK